MGRTAQAYKRYEWDYSTGTIKLKNMACPRCGAIMAHHREPIERHQCGRCGYTLFVSRSKAKGR